MKAAKLCESWVSLELLSGLVRLNIRVGLKVSSRQKNYLHERLILFPDVSRNFVIVVANLRHLVLTCHLIPRCVLLAGQLCLKTRPIISILYIWASEAREGPSSSCSDITSRGSKRLCTLKPDPETRKSTQQIWVMVASLDGCAKIDLKSGKCSELVHSVNMAGVFLSVMFCPAGLRATLVRWQEMTNICSSSSAKRGNRTSWRRSLHLSPAVPPALHCE